MLNGDGEYISPPPSWPLIQNKGLLLPQYTLNSGCKNNLQQFIEMENSGESLGRVLQEYEFLEFCKDAESNGETTEGNRDSK